MDKALEYLRKEMGYNISASDYYNKIEEWINIWKGKAAWLDINTVDGSKYPMYSLGMAKRSCEDLASVITSEPFDIKAASNDEILQEDIKKTKLFKKLPKAIEKMAYSGTVGTIIRIKNAEVVGEGEDAYLKKTDKTKKEIINVKANQIIPLAWDDDELIDAAFVSECNKLIDNKKTELIYIEVHQLKEKGYQITNVYLNKENGKEVNLEGVLSSYNTLSQVPLFNICKNEKDNIFDDNLGLGMAIYGDSIDQLRMLDLTYNNFGMDFRLGQKVMVINKKLTRVETEEYEDKDEEGKPVIKERQRVFYPTDLQKQQFMEITEGIFGNGDTKNPYIHEYNPDLRVGDNKEGIQFALDNYSFKIGYGTDYYSFDSTGISRTPSTATEAVISRQDFVDNMNKVRKSVNEYLKGVCKALLLSEKILGNANIDENQEIEVAEVDNFLQDDESYREKIRQDAQAGFLSKKTYLMKAYNLDEKEAEEELQRIEEEDSITRIEFGE